MVRRMLGSNLKLNLVIICKNRKHENERYLSRQSLGKRESKFNETSRKNCAEMLKVFADFFFFFVRVNLICSYCCYTSNLNIGGHAKLHIQGSFCTYVFAYEYLVKLYRLPLSTPTLSIRYIIKTHCRTYSGFTVTQI